MLSRLTLEDWRNFPQFDLKLESKTVIRGPNGAGKSNLLEAIRLISVGKSFKTRHLSEMIRHHQPFFRLKAKTSLDKLEMFFGQTTGVDGQQRRMLVNNQPIPLIDWFGRFPTAIFLPTDLEIVFGAPSTRRKFLDGILWQVDREFRQSSVELSRVLTNRQLLLRRLKASHGSREELAPWTRILLAVSQLIQNQRENLVNELNQLLAQGASQTPIGLEFRPNQATNLLTQEIHLTSNLIGAQRDQLIINWLDQPARQFASRGQARIIIIRLLIGQIQYLSQKLKTQPLILLDDLSSELDQTNAEQLMEVVSGLGPIIATTTDSAGWDDWQKVEL